MPTPLPVVVTHANTFHPDEVLAIALLERFYFQAKVQVHRTRDPKELQEATNNPEQFVVDVGFGFDPSKRNFDHHQQDMTHTWSDGTPFSACGLIWRHLRQEGFLSAYDQELLDRMEEVLIRPADKLDNGLLSWEPGMVIDGFNRGKDEQAQAFEKARAFAHELIDNLFYAQTQELEARQLIRDALTHDFDPELGILVLTERSGGSMTGVLAEEESQGQAQLILHPRQNGQQWSITTVPQSIHEPFSMKNPTPEAWRGRGDFEETIEGQAIRFVFCHKAGFMSIIEGSLEQAKHVAGAIRKHQLELTLSEDVNRTIRPFKRIP